MVTEGNRNLRKERNSDRGREDHREERRQDFGPLVPQDLICLTIK